MTTQHSFFDILYNSTLAGVVALFVFAMSPAMVSAQEEAADDDPAAIQLAPEQPAVPAASEERLHAAFLADETVTFTDRVSDLFAVGKLVIVRGEVEDNSFVAGESVELKSDRFGGDVFAAAESLNIDTEIDGDLYIVGSRLVILPDAVVHGDVWCGGELVRIEGAVDGQVHCGAGSATISGTVGGDVVMEVGELTIEDGARIGGSLTYTAPDVAEIAAGTVAGEVAFEKQELGEDCGAGGTDCEKDDGSGFPFFTFVIKTQAYLGGLVAGFILLALGGVGVRRMGRTLIEQPGASVGIGFVMWVAIPILSLVAICLFFTTQVGLISMVAFLVGSYLAMLVAAYALGDLLLRRGFHREDPSPYAAMALGLTVLHLFMLIPFIGHLIQIAVIMAGLGAAWVAARTRGDDTEPAIV